MANFNEMSEQQREEHYQKVCKAVGLDPDLRLLEYIWMPSENGFKNLVLYCRRGAAEILRAARGVSITKMTRAESSDSVSYIVEGADKTGRTEIAVGSHTLDGLRGDRKAHAEMTASTRGLRRLTLQFVGHGLLDESEVTAAQLNNVVVSPAPDVQLASTSIVFPPMPKISPNPEPGKEIERPILVPSTVAYVYVPTPEEPKAQYAVPNPALPAKPTMQEMRDEATRQLNERQLNERDTKEYMAAYNKSVNDPAYLQEKAAKTSAIQPAIYPDIPTTAVVATPVVAPVMTEIQPDKQADITPVKVRKPRGPNKKRNTVDISSPGQVSVPLAQATDPIVVEAARALNTIPAAVAFQINEAMRAVVNPVVPTQAFDAGGPPNVQPAAVPVSGTTVPNQDTDFPGKPTEEQKETYRVFLREYANVILPGAGMVPSEGIGGASAKLRLFAERQSGKSTSLMTVDDWEEFKAFFPDFLSRNSPKNLVQYINDVIGAK